MPDFQPRFSQPKMLLHCQSGDLHRASCEFLLDGGLIISHPQPKIIGDIVIVTRELAVRLERAYGEAAIEFIPRSSGRIAQELAILSPSGIQTEIVWEVEILCTDQGKAS